MYLASNETVPVRKFSDVRQRFVTWEAGGKWEWLGRDANGVLRFRITRRYFSRTARAKRVVYLWRNVGKPNESVETCSSVNHAKAYANNLARLWGLPPVRRSKRSARHES